MDESLYSVYMQCAANQTRRLCFPSIVEMVIASQQLCRWCCIFNPNGLYLPDLGVAKFTKPSRQCHVSFPFRHFPQTSRNFLDNKRKCKMKRKTSRTNTRVLHTQHISISSWYEVHRITRERHIFTDHLARSVDKIRLYNYNCILMGKGDKCHLHFMQHTVRLLTQVHCKTTNFFFHSFTAAMSYSLQASFNSVMKD